MPHILVHKTILSSTTNPKYDVEFVRYMVLDNVIILTKDIFVRYDRVPWIWIRYHDNDLLCIPSLVLFKTCVEPLYKPCIMMDYKERQLQMKHEHKI